MMKEIELTRKEASRLSWWLAFGFAMMAIGVFSSCGSYRASSSHSSKIETVENRDKTEKSTESTMSKKTEVDSVTEVEELVRVEFDTSKPIDRVTGMRPVSSITTINKKKDNVSEKEEVTNTEEKTVSVDKSDVSEKKEEAVTEDKKVKSDGFIWKVILFIFVAYAFYVFFPKIFLLFKK